MSIKEKKLSIPFNNNKIFSYTFAIYKSKTLKATGRAKVHVMDVIYDNVASGNIVTIKEPKMFENTCTEGKEI